MRNTLVIVCALAILVWAGPAWGAEGDYRWSYTGDGNWATASNWQVETATPDLWVGATVPPTITGYVNMQDLGNPNPVPYEYTITINQAGATASNLEFNRTNTRLLLTTGGDLSVYGCMTSYRGTGSTEVGGLFEMTGGTAHISGIMHGRWGNNGGYYATFKVSGGQILPFYRDPNGTGVIGDAGFHIGGGGTWYRGGIFHVVGSNSTIKILGGEEPYRNIGWDLSEYGTLISELDAGGITTIELDTNVSASLFDEGGDNATFTGGVIDIQGTAPTLGTSYTLLMADYIENTNVSLDVSDQLGGSADWGGNWWKLIINQGTESGLAANNGDNGSVVVTYLAPTKTLYWDTNGTTAGIGGSGNWNETDTNWTETVGGTGPMEAWSNTSADTTIANLTQSVVDQTVTLTTGISAGEVNLSSPGAMTITGNTLTMVAPSASVGGGNPKLKTLTDATDVTISSVIAGTEGLEMASASGTSGKVTLTAANTYSGMTYVSGGTLVAANNNALGATGAGNGTEISGGTLGLPGDITLPAGEALYIADTAINNIAGDNTIEGNITTIANYATISAASGSTLTVNGDVDIACYRLSVDGGGTVIFNGVITGGPGGSSEDGNILVSSTGTTVILNGDNTYSGYTYVWWGSGRKLIITHDNALGSAGNEWGYTLIGRSYHTLGLQGGITCAEELRICYSGLEEEGRRVGVIENISGDNTLTGAITLYSDQNTLRPSTTIGSTDGTLTINGAIDTNFGDTCNPGETNPVVLTFDANKTGDTIIVNGAIGHDYTNGESTLVPGELTKIGAGTLILNGANTYTGDTIVSAGTLGGSGSFVGNVIVEDGATLAPGTSTGTLTIGGDLTLAATAAAKMEVGGASDFDQLPVVGTATLAGTLDMSRVGGYIPTKDQEFILLTAGSVDNTGGMALSPEDVGTWELTVTDGASGSVVTKWLPSFAGDANADGDVDDADLSILLANFGDPGAWKTGDFNGDGSIDDADLSILLTNFGSETVPEPATLTLLGLGALALIRRRRNK